MNALFRLLTHLERQSQTNASFRHAQIAIAVAILAISAAILVPVYIELFRVY